MAKTVVGLFDVNDPESFARSAAISFGAIIVQNDGSIRLAPGRRTAN